GLRSPVSPAPAQRGLVEPVVVESSKRPQVREWWSGLHGGRVTGLPRAVSETLDIGLPLMRRHLALGQRYEPWARPRYQSSLYRFLTYLLPGQEELKNAGAGA